MDRVHRERPLHAHQRSDAGIAGLELDAGQAVGDCTGARAAVPLEVHAQDTERSELESELTRGDRALLEPVAHAGLDPRLDIVAHDVADRALLLRQQRVEVEQTERGLGRAGHGVLRGEVVEDPRSLARIGSNIQVRRRPDSVSSPPRRACARSRARPSDRSTPWGARRHPLPRARPARRRPG